MFNFSASTKIYLCQQPVNLRKSFDGLVGAVQYFIKEDPSSGHLFVFVNKAHKLMKILYWDNDGYVIWSKRLSQGLFNIPKSVDGKIELNYREFQAILCGIKPQRYYKRFNAKKH
ncbi:MAG: IS66 family insertion sequence element accessory protein TnpB [Candidatus Gastranaerophilales bacterium]